MEQLQAAALMLFSRSSMPNGVCGKWKQLMSLMVAMAKIDRPTDCLFEAGRGWPIPAHADVPTV